MDDEVRRLLKDIIEFDGRRITKDYIGHHQWRSGLLAGLAVRAKELLEQERERKKGKDGEGEGDGGGTVSHFW